MSHNKKYYSFLFWDYPEIEHIAKKKSLQEFRRYLKSLKTSDPLLFNLILRRLIERGSLTEVVQLFGVHDIEDGLKRLHLWDKVPKMRLYAWQNTFEFLKQLKNPERSKSDQT